MSAASALAEALSSGVRPRIDAAVERACSEGTLRPFGDAWISAHDDDEAWSTIALCPSWRDAGFLPFHAKRHSATGSDADVLTALSGAIGSIPQLGAPPLWVGDKWLVTLHLPRSINLAQVLEGGGETVAIIRHCLDSLAAFADREALWQTAIAEIGCKPPPAFPLVKRYEAACDQLKRIYGDADLHGLPGLAPPEKASGSLALFCDPKPANFIRPTGDASRIYRIDLDLMTYSAPLSLQAAIAAFSVPSEPRGLKRQETFVLRLAQWKAWCAARSAGPEDEQLRIVLYHLIRNLASAWLQRNTGKAHTMADMLIQLIDTEPHFRSLRHFRDTLARTLISGSAEAPP